MAFEVGNKVRVVANNHIGEASTLIGCTGEVTEIDEEGANVYVSDDPFPIVGLEPLYYFENSELELIEDAV